MRERLKLLVVRVGYGHGPKLASWVRERWVRLRNPMADISFGRGCYLGPGFSIHAPWGGAFHAGERCEFRRGFRAELEGPSSSIEIGPDSVFTYEGLVQCASSIRIGTRSAFGQACQFVDGKHRFRDLTKPALDQGYDLRPITVGDDVLVLSKCTILADLGDRTIVGANSVVTKDTPAYSVTLGAPARAVDYFGPGGGEPEGLGRSPG